jgi:hypothetical protein
VIGGLRVVAARVRIMMTAMCMIVVRVAAMARRRSGMRSCGGRRCRVRRGLRMVRSEDPPGGIFDIVGTGIGRIVLAKRRGGKPQRQRTCGEGRKKMAL